MAEIVNLRQVRKKKARAEQERIAEQNRAIHGRSKAERRHAQTLAEKETAFIEGHRRDHGEDGSER